MSYNKIIMNQQNTKPPIRNIAQRYFEYLEIEKGASKKTLENYKRYLERFLTWANIKNPQEIDQELIRQYRLYLNRLNNNTLKRVTQNYHLIALRNFLRYLIKQDIKSLSPDKIELAKKTEKEIEILNSQEIERLLKAPLKSKKTDLSCLRDKAILEMLFSTGLRVSELCKLDREKINFETCELSIKGKGGKVRVVFLSDNAKAALKTYLNKRKDVDLALFVRIKKIGGSDNLRLTPRSIQRIVRKWSTAAGITKKITPHTLRHSFATDLLAGGADLRSVQALLGHANVSTTQIYTHITDQNLKKIHEQYHHKKK
jgi:site-specific recombinase XerD